MEENNIFTIADQDYIEISRVTLNEKVYVYLNKLSNENEFIIKEYEEENNILKDVIESDYTPVLKALEKELTIS